MKLSATIVLTFRSESLGEAGAVIDELLASTRARDDVDVTSVDLQTPVPEPPVTLPAQAAPPTPSPGVPHPLPGSG